MAPQTGFFLLKELSAMILLPFISLLMFLNRQAPKRSFLLSLVINGLFIAVSTELLGLAGALTGNSVLIAWLLMIAIGFFLRSRVHAWCVRGRSGAAEAHTPAAKAMLATLALLAGLLGVVAVVAAPNNWDSLTYHLPRILHWIQNGSVAHYPTHITRQLIMPPWSEYAMTHLYLLGGGDRFVNGVQWLSMVGCCVGVMLIVEQLGGTLVQQYAAGIVAVSLPIGLLEATSTQNDYALAFWCVAVVVYGIDAVEEVASWPNALLIAVSLGLALLTKGTGYIILCPVVLGILTLLLRRPDRKALAVKIAAVAAIVLALNGGLYLRNWSVFGSPLTTDGDIIVNKSADPRLLLLLVVRSLGVHLSTGSETVNNAIHEVSVAAHKAVGVETNDPRLFTGYSYRVFPYRNHEDYASNPLHMLMLLVAAGAAVVLHRRIDRRTLWYGAVIVASFLLLSFLIRWNVWLSRYFVPIFIMSAPFIVMACRAFLQKHVAAVVLVVLAGNGFYVAATNETRPLVGPQSILTRDRLDQYFANAPDLRPYFKMKVARIVMSGQTNVALTKLTGDAWEYPLWVMLGATGRTYRIEHVTVGNKSKSIPLRGFAPYTEVAL